MSQKRVLVTGSSRGIGRAIAQQLAKDGWDVAVHFMQRRVDAEETLNSLGKRAAGLYEADLRDSYHARGLVDRVLKDGPLHAVVNNAGVYVTLDYEDASEAVFEAAYNRCMTVNFESPAWIVRSATRYFADEQISGRVVNVASRVGHKGEAGAAFYSASKAALLNLTKALAVEQAELGIRHFAIAPGWVDTAMARDSVATRIDEILESIPLKRMATPEDCANAVSFFLKPESDYLSGTVIDINGASYIR